MYGLLLQSILLFVVLGSLRLAPPAVYAREQRGETTTVQAEIPSTFSIRLFGYTAPNAFVEASGVRVFAQVLSDKAGYFLIDPLPISYEAKEICVTTIDETRRSGFPVCIKLPTDNKPKEIGPLLLAPTLSISSSDIYEKAQAYATGKTIPNANVILSFFDSPRSARLGTLIREVYASDLPRIITTSDFRGNFSINLPTNKPLSYRLFAKAFWQEAPTFKSQTLTFSILSSFEFWLRFILPWIIVLILLVCLIGFGVWYERKHGYGRKFLQWFIEKKLRPFAVKRHLELQPILNRFQGYLQKYQK